MASMQSRNQFGRGDVGVVLPNPARSFPMTTATDDAAVLNMSVGSAARLERMQAALRALLLHWFM